MGPLRSGASAGGAQSSRHPTPQPLGSASPQPWKGLAGAFPGAPLSLCLLWMGNGSRPRTLRIAQGRSPLPTLAPLGERAGGGHRSTWRGREGRVSFLSLSAPPVPDGRARSNQRRRSLGEGGASRGLKGGGGSQAEAAGREALQPGRTSGFGGKDLLPSGHLRWQVGGSGGEGAPPSFPPPLLSLCAAWTTKPSWRNSVPCPALHPSRLWRDPLLPPRPLQLPPPQVPSPIWESLSEAPSPAAGKPRDKPPWVVGTPADPLLSKPPPSLVPPDG